MSKVINRKTKEITETLNPAGSTFLYNNFFGRLILNLVDKKFISAFVGKFMDSKLSKVLIDKFIADNNIDMSEYQKVEYNSFNEFFSRKIEDNKRIFSKKDSDFCSPCDSKLLVYKIDTNLNFIIKNKIYNTKKILRDEKLADEYQDGYLLVFRLEVDDYHRYSYIDDGKVLDTKNIKGLYHTVAPICFEKFKCFEENVRKYQILQTKNFDKIIQMEVGAMFVGKIYNHQILNFKKGDEKGYFLFGGSTVVLFVKKDIIKIDEDIIQNSNKNLETKILMGEKIASKIN